MCYFNNISIPFYGYEHKERMDKQHFIQLGGNNYTVESAHLLVLLNAGFSRRLWICA